MKYISQTFSYLKKNFPLILLAMIVPSIAACFLSTPFWEVSFVSGYDYDPFIPFGKLFGIVFDDYWKYVWPVVLISALQIASSSLVMSAVDRHFRTGKLSLKSPFRLMNISIFPVFLGVIIMCAVGIVWRFVLYGLVALVQTIAAAATLNAGATLAIISVLAVGLFIVHLLIITPMMYWAPLMFVYGYGLRDAAAYSFKMISGKKIYTGLFIPLIACAGIQLLMGFLGAHIAVDIAVNFVVYLFTNTYVTVYIIVSFYNLSDLDRRDVVVYAPIVTEAVKAAEKSDKDKNAGADTDNVEGKNTSEDASETVGKKSKKPDGKKSAKTVKKASVKVKTTGDGKKQPPKSEAKNRKKRSEQSVETAEKDGTPEITEERGNGNVV